MLTVGGQTGPRRCSAAEGCVWPQLLGRGGGPPSLACGCRERPTPAGRRPGVGRQRATEAVVAPPDTLLRVFLRGHVCVSGTADETLDSSNCELSKDKTANTTK